LGSQQKGRKISSGGGEDMHSGGKVKIVLQWNVKLIIPRISKLDFKNIPGNKCL